MEGGCGRESTGAGTVEQDTTKKIVAANRIFFMCWLNIIIKI